MTNALSSHRLSLLADPRSTEARLTVECPQKGGKKNTVGLKIIVTKAIHILSVTAPVIHIHQSTPQAMAVSEQYVGPTSHKMAT